MTKMVMEPVGILMDARYTHGIYWYGPTIPFENSELYVVSQTRRRSSRKTKREWVGLTKEEIDEIGTAQPGYTRNIYKAIEAKLKEKNT